MTAKQKTLVICTPGFAASEEDTACLPVQQELVKALNRADPALKIIILTFQYPFEKKTYQWYGNTVIACNGRNRGGLHRFLLRKKIMQYFNDLRKQYTIDVLLSFWYGECAFIAKKAGERYGIRYYCWLLGQDTRAKNKYPAHTRYGSSSLIALSDFLQNEFLRNHGVRPAMVIAPGVDMSRFDAVPLQRDIDLLAAGSLIPLKQYPVFLQVLAAVKNRFPAINAIIIGDGPELQRLQAMAIECGLQVVFTGSLPYANVLQYMQRAKVFLHPSSYEGFSGVCTEAIAAGAQVISFCRPMNEPIAHWQIAASVEEMITMATGILANPAVDHTPVTAWSIESTAQKMLATLFRLSNGEP